MNFSANNTYGNQKFADLLSLIAACLRNSRRGLLYQMQLAVFARWGGRVKNNQNQHYVIFGRLLKHSLGSEKQKNASKTGRQYNGHQVADCSLIRRKRVRRQVVSRLLSIKALVDYQNDSDKISYLVPIVLSSCFWGVFLFFRSQTMLKEPSKNYVMLILVIFYPPPSTCKNRKLHLV
jgi:hypothetical protein